MNHCLCNSLSARCSASLLFGLLLVPLLTLADGGPRDRRAAEPPLDRVERGTLLLDNGAGPWQPAPTVDTRVDMRIAGMVARVAVEQRFTNSAAEWVNGIYVFPLPEGAAVDQLRLQIGERYIEGQIQERDVARRSYEQAMRTGLRATLVEQQRANVFTTRVANIGPGETVVVRIEYQDTARFDAGRFTLRFPLTIGIRYIPGLPVAAGPDGGGWSHNTDQVPDASSITPPVTVEGGHDNPVSITVELDPGFPLERLESAYHPIRQQRLGPRRYLATLADGTVPANRDFELSWQPIPHASPRAAVFSQQRGADGYSLVMLLPPTTAAAGPRALQREIIFVIDTSGSMEGQPLEQAKTALLDALARLTPEAHFNVIEFNSITRKLAQTSMAATPDALGRAAAFVRRLYATGGTEIASALAAALDGSTAADRLRQVVFLTDGSVGNEAALLRQIDASRGDARLFTVGIGAAPNTYFMREAAASGRGTYTYIGAIDEVEPRMRALFEKLEHPVLTDLTLTGAGGDALAYAPDPMADLYAHEPLLVSVKHPRETAALTFRGRLRDATWSSELTLAGGEPARGLDVLWARNRIASLERSASRGAPPDAVKAAITALGLDYHLVTAHTSLVAVDVTPARPAQRQAVERTIPLKRPHGWDMPIPPGRLPQTATPLLKNGLIALVAALLAGVSGWCARRRCVA